MTKSRSRTLRSSSSGHGCILNFNHLLMNSNILNSVLNIQANPLKRTYSENQRKFNAPPLPEMKSCDLTLQAFTHKSLRRPNATPEQYGDNERLADLGKVVLVAATTRTLFNIRPILQAAEIFVG
jgi:dsRNA-specific ribonuclease